MPASDDDEPFEAQFSIDYDDVNRIEFFFLNTFFILVYLGKSKKTCQEKR
jgi:hypothetical protein